MNILILGGDGYLGWPTAMYFSARGHDVTVVDNYLRRKNCLDIGVQPLYSTPTLQERAKIWYERTGYEISVIIGDLKSPEFCRSIFNGSATYQYSINKKKEDFDVVVHYAEQPSAPYSLMSYKHADETLTNNLQVTNNLMFAVRDYSPQTHIIKLGTMGEYGTPNIDIEEGWIEIEHKGRKDKFLFPRAAGSIYHTTKVMDTDLLWFGVRMWDLKVTDLMQGPVYGTETEESDIDERLKTIFNYDEVFGTVLNRFVVQAVCGYPLTVYGKGGQTRGYLNIKDTLQCVFASANNSPANGELRIFNQIMEVFSVNDLACNVKSAAESLGIDVKINKIDNPRKEAEEHYYNPTYQGLLDMGVKPNFLTKDVLCQMITQASKYKGNINQDVIFRGVTWKKAK